jgi:hypothetical protein
LQEELTKKQVQLAKDKDRFLELKNKLNQAKQDTDSKESKAQQVYLHI